MLDLNKLSLQLRQATLALEQDANGISYRQQYALQVWNQAVENDQLLGEKLLRSLDHLPWPMARPLEPLRQKSMSIPLPMPHTVVATDGSQIVPSHHEISPCYLINIGKIMYSYGTGEIPIQESEPYFYHLEKDLYIQMGRQRFSITEDFIGIERTLRELDDLAQLCQQAAKKNHPVVAMVDGSLTSLLQDLQNLPGDLAERILNRFLGSLDRIRQTKVPMCGYISHSRRSEVLHFLRLQICPYEDANCEKTCQEGEEPCSGIQPLADRNLWSEILKKGERSGLFGSTLKANEKLGAHQVCFFYLNNGYEVARIELPRWVADEPNYLDLVHTLCLSQVEKGYGYPIALAESHNRAVIKGSDRAQFYAMLSRKMIEGNRPVALSHKELKKRGGIA